MYVGMCACTYICMYMYCLDSYVCDNACVYACSLGVRMHACRFLILILYEL